MTTKKLTKLLALYLPYILLGLVATNLGEAWRLAEGKELGEHIMSMMGTFPVAFANPLPSLHPLDLLIGFSCGTGLRLAVYLRSKNAKKYRHGMEYGIHTFKRFVQIDLHTFIDSERTYASGRMSDDLFTFLQLDHFSFGCKSMFELRVIDSRVTDC